MSDDNIQLSEEAKNLEIGTYEHFKGGHYEVIGVGRLSEDKEAGEFVIYKSLKNNTIWCRPIKMFLENIEAENYKGPRFRKV